MQLVRKFLCFFGFHDYRVFKCEAFATTHRCNVCGKFSTVGLWDYHC